jgi:hypothetical protein
MKRGKEEFFDPTKQEFIFSIYPNDLLKIEREDVIIKGYYVKANPTDGFMTLMSMDNVDDGIFKKSIVKYILRINIDSQMNSDEKRECVESIKGLDYLKKKKPNGIYSLIMDISIKDVAEPKDKTVKNLFDTILDELSKKYSFEKIENNTKTVEIKNIYNGEHDIKLSLKLDVEYDNRALTGTGTSAKSKIISFRKLKIDLLGNITELPYETERKPFIKR